FTTGAGFKDEVWGTRDALSRRLGRELTLAEASSWLVHEGISFATHHPLEEAKLLALKFYYFWNRTEAATNLSYYFARDFSGVLRGVPLGFGVVAALALLGIVLNRRRWREQVFLHVFWLSGLLTALLFFVSAEYRIPALPPLLLFAANAPLVVAGWLGWGARRRTSADAAAARAMSRSLGKNVLVAGGCLIVFALFCNARDERMRFQSLKRVDYLNFGVLYKERGDLERAEAMFRRSLAIDAKYAPAYAELADIEHRRGNEIEAARLAAEARRFRPANAPTDTPGVPDVQDLLLQAGTLYKGRQYAEALRLFTVIRTRAESVNDAELRRSALNNIGLCKLQMGELDTAAVVFQSLMTEAPTYVKAVNNLAKVRLVEGKKAEAAALFRRALEIDPENRIAREELAKLQP
ncbi:MAG TPA: tetratricopeptide repeat protein, partial [Candidatus Eisenbacteria bacterium]|nr:tetratricopeptide repeat protein [Candidatus Eisenbacteria bacterium]